MPKKLNSVQEYLVQEYVEEYQEGHISRRDMVRYVLAITGSVASAATVLVACGGAAPVPAPTATTQAAVTAPTPTQQSVPATPTAAATPPAVAASTATVETGTTPTTGASTSPTAGTPAAQNRSGVTVPENDPAIQVTSLSLDRGSFQLKAYLARPSNATPVPGVIVIHENRGLQEHIKDVARRAAKAGFVALAPDLVSRQGGTDNYQDASAITGILGNANQEELTSDLVAAAAHLQAQSFVKPGGIGVVGFCLGGLYTWRLAIADKNIRAAAPFYGPVPQNSAGLAESNAAFLIILGSNDRFVNPTIPNAESVLKASNKTYEIKTYEGANHQFHNDTAANYNAEAAKDAWARTIAWFEKYLKG